MITARPNREECGVFGVWAPGEEVSLTYFGLFALQHRGQEAAVSLWVMMTASSYSKTWASWPTSLMNPSSRPVPAGNVAVGHTRYPLRAVRNGPTPMFGTSPSGVDIALGHNGNLVNYLELRAEAIERGLIRMKSRFLTPCACPCCLPTA